MNEEELRSFEEYKKNRQRVFDELIELAQDPENPGRLLPGVVEVMKIARSADIGANITMWQHFMRLSNTSKWLWLIFGPIVIWLIGNLVWIAIHPREAAESIVNFLSPWAHGAAR